MNKARNKAMNNLLQLLAHAKAAAYHLRRCEAIARSCYSHSVAQEFDAARGMLASPTGNAERAYGAAALLAVRRAR